MAKFRKSTAASAAQINELLQQHPEYTLSDLASALGYTRQHVSYIIKKFDISYNPKTKSWRDRFTSKSIVTASHQEQIEFINLLAKEKGMSYGQYVSLCHAAHKPVF